MNGNKRMRGRMGLRKRIIVTSLASSAAALVALLLFVGPGLRARARDHERETLIAESRLMARVVMEHIARGGGLADLDPVVDAAASEVRARVSVIDPAGRIVADSAVSGPDLSSLPNHHDRPEVRDALASGVGISVRHSATTGEDLMYVAVPVRGATESLAVARVAHSLAGIEAQLRELRRSVLFSLLLAFLVTAALAMLLGSSLVGPLRESMDAARRLGAGDLSSRVHSERLDELGELAHVLNQTASQLQERLAEAARDRGRIESLISAMEEGVLAVDHKGQVLLANEVLRRYCNLDEPIGHHYLEVIRQHEVAETIESVLRDGARRTAEIELQHPTRCFALTAAGFPGVEGAPHGVVVVFRDITALSQEAPATLS